MDALLETGLPSGFSEVKRTPETLLVTHKDLPWFRQDSRLDLMRVTLRETGAGDFYYCSSFGSDESLVKAARSLSEKQSIHANSMLYSRLHDLVLTQNHHWKRVDNSKVDRTIWYTGNESGQRVYAVRFDNVGSIPVIMRIAVCDKAQQERVLSVLTDATRKHIKQLGKL
jgi:hypothetical protein